MSRAQATWRLHLPHLLNKIAPTELASQPITTAFRFKDNGLFMGVDPKGASSGLRDSENVVVSHSIYPIHFQTRLPSTVFEFSFTQA